MRSTSQYNSESSVDVIQMAAKPMFWKRHPLDTVVSLRGLRKSSTSLDFWHRPFDQNEKTLQERNAESCTSDSVIGPESAKKMKKKKRVFATFSTCLFFFCSLLGFFVDQMTSVSRQLDRCLCHLPILAENFGAASP